MDGARPSHLGEEQRGDEEPGDDEEHVDADVAAAERADVGVEEHHEHDRDRAEALDVGPKAERAERKCLVVPRRIRRRDIEEWIDRGGR